MLVTTCPECKTTFRVSVGILEKAAGQVRCGRCSTIFNANDALEDIDDPSTQSSAGSSFRFELQPEQEMAVEIAPRWGEDDDAEDTDVSVALSDEGIEWVDEDETADDAAPQGEEPEPEQEPGPATETEPESDPVTTTEEPDWLTPADQAPRRSRLWSVAAFLLLLTLVGQLTHQYRAELVAVPALEPAISRVYELLGREVSPVPDLRQYDLLDLTAVAQPTSQNQGWLMIETRVHNGGPKPQPYPYILVRLLDRWEDTIAGRYFAPDEYAVSPIRNSAQMNSGSTIDAQFIIMDPGPSATGFELELCVAANNGYLCESDIVNE